MLKHLNHRSNLFFQVPNNFEMLTCWWRELNHGELMQQFADYLLDMETSSVIILDVLNPIPVFFFYITQKVLVYSC